jgi:hypothetical protein
LPIDGKEPSPAAPFEDILALFDEIAVVCPDAGLLFRTAFMPSKYSVNIRRCYLQEAYLALFASSNAVQDT